MAQYNIYSILSASARARPDHPAVVFEGRTLTYSELDREVVATSARLRALGVGPGDRVLIYAPNRPEHYFVSFGAQRIGAIFAPINIAFRLREVTYILSNARAALIVIDASVYRDFCELVGDHPDLPPKIAILGAVPEDARTDPRVVGALEDVPAGEIPDAYDCGREEPCLICYTSGSTSTPKAVLHSHRGALFSARTYAQVWKHRPDDRAIVVPPMSWIFGISTTSHGLFAGGSTVFLMPRFHPETALDAIQRHRATKFFGTTSMYTKMLDVLSRRDFDLSSLRFCMIGGEPCPEGAVRPAEERFGVRFCQAWALTENHPMLAMEMGDVDAPRGTAGRPVPGASVRLLDADGKDVPVGTPGEAFVSGPGAMLGYFREPQMTAERVEPDGSIRTGDLLVRDAAGYLFVVGRASDMIIRSGANIAPAEVETALLEHPDVAAVCVVGAPDPVSGEEVVAYVVPADGRAIAGEDLLPHLRQRLASYKIPTTILLRDELPSNMSGKLDRVALKAEAARLREATP